MVILGIDPGFTASGFGILKKEASNKIYLLDYGYLKMSSSKPLHERVGFFYDCFFEKIEKFEVTDISLETSFLGKNAQNFLKLGYLRGILYLLAAQKKLTLHEFAPREVKLAVTGFGGASKEQVSRVILQLFPKISSPEKADVTDALAIMLCGLWHTQRNFLR
ncbi:MAG: Crossover junction endodeoxyribonuclease RuvC [candidate division TM6 bacterium GW2011_GWF2_32_72]|nr:MAG: Crossover junction endodeoxyribonuclease RuvC [candidate division TM6 bacterium GW2011_GWF2_32_72]